MLTEQLSLAEGSVQETTAPQAPASLFTEMFPGVLAMAGASPSVTVTVKDS